MQFWFGRRWRRFRNATRSPLTLYVPVQCVKKQSFLVPGKQGNTARDTPLPLSCSHLMLNPTIEVCGETIDSSRLSTVVLCRWKASANSSSENTDGRPNRGWSWQLLSPSLNVWNHRRHVKTTGNERALSIFGKLEIRMQPVSSLKGPP